MSDRPPVCRKCFGTLDDGKCYECGELDGQPDVDRNPLQSLTLILSIIFYIILISIFIECAVSVHDKEYFLKLLIPESLLKYYNSELTSKEYHGKQHDDFFQIGEKNKKFPLDLRMFSFVPQESDLRFAPLNHALLFHGMEFGEKREGHRLNQQDIENKSRDRIGNKRNITLYNSRIAAMNVFLFLC